MKKHTEKQPIDDLFARKLGNLSLTPSNDGFERLQARMGPRITETRVVFWRNPVMQRYAAAAACLALVCGTGWKYWPVASDLKETRIAVTKPLKIDSPLPTVADSKTQTFVPQNAPKDVTPPEQPLPTVDNQLAEVRKLIQGTSTTRKSTYQTKVDSHQERNETALAQAKMSQATPKINDEIAPDITPVQPANSKQLAVNEPATKPLATSERVLVVTIAEPESLVASNYEGKALNDGKTQQQVEEDDNDKGNKSGSLWQQVKRFKQGEIFARRDNRSNDDRGLLSRAYSGLKQSIEKEKSTKQ